MPVAPVLNFEEVRNEPHFRQNGYVVDAEHPTYGTYSTVGVAARYSDTPPGALGVAPDLGEHTSEVLKEICEMSDAEIQQLSADNVTTPNPATYTPPVWMNIHKPKPKL